jgi:hypothetical protein
MASLTYNSNPNLKSNGVNVGYTEDQVLEYIKCSKDPIYFIENYIKILTLDDGLILFKLFDYQINFINSIHNNARTIGMFPRQHGKTTTVAAYLVWYCNFNNGKNVAMLANKVASAREVMSRFQMMFEELPSWLQTGVVEWNKGTIVLENKSKAFISATTSSGIRGKTCNLLYLDELSSVPNNVAEEFFASTYPTISSGESSKVIITSTPIGYNHFYKMWNDSEQGINGFVNTRVEYWEHPKHDKIWADKQKELLGDVKYCQEVLMHFQGSSYTLINSDTLSRLSASPYIYSKDGLDVYERPEINRIYTMIVDVAKGVGEDYSAFSIIDITETPYKLVAKYKDNYISPMLYPNVIYKMGMEYNEANILIEGNIGEQVGYILYEELEYENILFINRTTAGQVITGGFGTGRSQVGVITDKKVKRIGCSSLKMLIEENKLLIPDGDIISELSTFIETKGSYAADIGYHDDLVMTLVLFGWLVNQPYFKELNNVDLRQMVYQNQMRQIEDGLTPFGFYNDGTEQEQQWSNF